MYTKLPNKNNMGPYLSGLSVHLVYRHYEINPDNLPPEFPFKNITIIKCVKCIVN